MLAPAREYKSAGNSNPCRQALIVGHKLIKRWWTATPVINLADYVGCVSKRCQRYKCVEKLVVKGQ